MIYVVGLGPGNPDYTLPIAIKTIRGASMVIGGTRNLGAVKEHCSKTMDIRLGFTSIGHYLSEHSEENIAVVVSGDTGFYSMLAFVKRHVSEKAIKVIPGISSLQYMYARLAKGYEESRLLSVHGRSTDLNPLIEARRPMGILTDQEQNNRTIATLLKTKGCEDAVVYVGERLSYKDERISRLTVEESMTFEADALSVVIIDYEN